MTEMTAMTAAVAVQLYTLREEVAALGPRSVMERIAAAGYAGVESASLYDLAPRDFATMLHQHGLTLASAHVGLTRDPADYRAALDAHAEAGAKVVVIPALAPDGFGDLDAVKRSADIANHALDETRARGLALGYHNHYWEFPLVEGTPALVHFFELVHPDVFAEVDIYWAQVGGVDPAVLVSELGARVRLLHVKDGPADEPASAMTAVGQGAVDVAAVLTAAPTAQWHIVELDRCATDMFGAVEASHDYLVGTGLSTGGAGRA